jgi:hypothetical protein
MKALVRSFRRHYGATAKRVAVRSRRPWYWRLLIAGVLLLLGYLAAYWQWIEGGFDAETMHSLSQKNQILRANIVRAQRQLQIERAAQSNLAKEISDLQDESMRLKEDVAFYRNIVNDDSGAGELKFYSFRLRKSAQPGRYDYYILLAQSGRNNKMVEGQIRLTLSSAQGEKTVLLLNDVNQETAAIKINFKYYQRLEGSFIAPQPSAESVVEASFIEAGAVQPRISQKVDLPV